MGLPCNVSDVTVFLHGEPSGQGRPRGALRTCPAWVLRRPGSRPKSPRASFSPTGLGSPSLRGSEWLLLPGPRPCPRAVGARARSGHWVQIRRFASQIRAAAPPPRRGRRMPDGCSCRRPPPRARRAPLPPPAEAALRLRGGGQGGIRLKASQRAARLTKARQAGRSWPAPHLFFSHLLP